MRFHQLEVGAQFEYHGERYTKSTNLVAVKHDGSQKFMQRSALVTPASAQTASTEKLRSTGSTDSDCIVQAHERFYQTCLASVMNANLGQADLTSIKKTFKEAHEQFLSELHEAP